jgi:chromosome partitioning protein
MSARRTVSAHVIVVGNEKGGTGKSTLAMHLSVALMNFGQRVATIDLDSRQKTFTHYVENRRNWSKRCGGRLKIPMHFCVSSGSTRKLDENEAIEFTRFADALASIDRAYDFLVIDTPGTDNHLTRLAHSMADTLVTPINDSFLDFDVARHPRSNQFCRHWRKSLRQDGARGAPPAASVRRPADN